MHRFLLHNGEIRETSAKVLSPGQVGVMNGWGVFSTLRVKQGVLFAWERHFARMKKDAELMHIPFPADPAGMAADIGRLLHANEAYNATLRVAIVRNRGGMFEAPVIEHDYDMIAFTKDLNHWGDGVRLSVKQKARLSGSDFSGAKILSWSMNLTWLEEAQQRGFDEMMLLDDRGLVSECTGANIFIVRGGEVWTPPLSCGCLPGVTRAILLEEIRVPGISVAEREITPEELALADDVFITSSTRDLLPVHEIDGVSRAGSRGRVREELLEAFRAHLTAYIAQSKVNFHNITA